MIESLTKKQMAGVATAWHGLSDLKPDDRRREGFSDGREWGIAHPFDASLAVIEFFCWWIACNMMDAKLERSVDYFHQAMLAEIGEDECDRIIDMEISYRTGWLLGVVDIFVLAGGDLLMDEWNVTTKH
jgi:hypothetical protein